MCSKCFLREAFYHPSFMNSDIWRSKSPPESSYIIQSLYDCVHSPVQCSVLCSHRPNSIFPAHLETEPLSHTENGLSKDDSTKDPAPSTRSLHTASDYRATKKERPYYPGQTHTPPPLRRVSSNPTELGPMCAHRRVEGRVKIHTQPLGQNDCSGQVL